MLSRIQSAAVDANPEAVKKSAHGWTCPTCHLPLSTRFCPSCGERRLHERSLTLGGLLEQAFEALTHVDGRVFRSFRYLVTRPGLLTAAYLIGQRKPYIAPFQLFLVVNLLFFASQSLTGWKIFSTLLFSHLHGQIYSPIAERLVTERLSTLRTTLDAYTPVFDHAVALYAKSLIILMVPPLAILALLLFRRNKPHVVAHAVFSLHFFAFQFAILCVLLPFATAATRLGRLNPAVVDAGLGILQLVVVTTYFYIAVRRVYGATGLERVVKVAALTVAVACIWIGYRFVVFLITLYGTELS